MKKSFLYSFCILLIISVPSFAQEGEQVDPQMKAWMDYMTPGEMHQMLASSNGTWKTKISMWMAPGTEPMVSEGTSNNEMILGGRYQKSKHTGDFMGMPMEGMNLLGFDNATKEFYATWVDNLGTGMMMSKGKYDESTKKVNMKGTYVDPMDAREKPFRQTYEIVNDNHHVMEMFMNDESGKEFKTMHIDFTRQ